MAPGPVSAARVHPQQDGTVDEEPASSCTAVRASFQRRVD